MRIEFCHPTTKESEGGAGSASDRALKPDATLQPGRPRVYSEVPDALAEVIADFMVNGVVTAETLQERLAAAQLAAQ